jgi:ATP-dependent Clp protease protease subunit
MITVRKMAARRIDNKLDVQNKDNSSTIYLYGDIGGWFGIDHQEFIKELNAIDSDTIHLRVDSGGGDVFAARAIKTAIMQHKANVIAHIDGLAASAASFLAMGANEIEIVDGGFIMIHNALSFLDIFGYFNEQAIDDLVNDLDKEKKLHKQLNESIANDYVKKTGKSLEEILDYMQDETWFTAKQALDNGFVDRIYDGDPVEGNYDLSIYDNVPDRIKNRNRPEKGTKKDLNERDLEKDLRDAGYSRNQSKEMVAKVFHNERDAQNELDKQNQREVEEVVETDQRDAEETPTGEMDQIENAIKLIDPVTDLLEKANSMTREDKK